MNLQSCWIFSDVCICRERSESPGGLCCTSCLRWCPGTWLVRLFALDSFTRRMRGMGYDPKTGTVGAVYDRASLIAGKARGHRPRLQWLVREFCNTLKLVTLYSLNSNLYCS